MGGGGSALRVCAEHRGGINWLSLSPDGQRLLTGSEDGTARLWSTADGQCCALLQGRPAAPCLRRLSLSSPPTLLPASDLASSVRRPHTQSPAPTQPTALVEGHPPGSSIQPIRRTRAGGARWGGVGAQSRLRSGAVG